MWILIIGAVFAASAGGLVYLALRSADLPFVRRSARGKRRAAVLICLAFYVLLTAVLGLLLNFINALICILHLVLFRLLCGLAAFALSKLRHRRPRESAVGTAAAVLCLVYLTYGWIAAHHVSRTDYVFSSPKLTEDLRIVQITDAHIGATFDAGGFSEYVREINALSPDAVVVTGDFVDDGTSREELLGGCDALGMLETRLGVYFVWGNHDRGYYSDERRG